MTDVSAELEALLAAAKADFASRIDDKLRELHELSKREAWAEARRAAHKLRGSAATYGFPKIGAAAGAMEDVLVEAGPAPSDDVRKAFASALAAAQSEPERLGSRRP